MRLYRLMEGKTENFDVTSTIKYVAQVYLPQCCGQDSYRSGD